jgi:hypothetical protein
MTYIAIALEGSGESMELQKEDLINRMIYSSLLLLRLAFVTTI